MSLVHIYTPFPYNQNRAAVNEYYGFPSEKITCPSYYYPVRDVNFIKLKGAGCAEISVLGVGGLNQNI